MKGGDKQSKLSNITKELNLDTTNKNSNSTIVYMDKTGLEENENNIPSNNLTGTKVSFSDVLKNFDLPTILNEKTQTKMKNTLKNFVKNKDTSKVEIKFDDTEGRKVERSKNYDSMVKDVTKYQSRVKINREADVVDFTTNHHSLSFSAKSIVNNSSVKDMNDYEKSIKDLLVKNKYDTEEKILEEENKKLMTIDPEEVKRRYEELKKVKGLLFQQEIKNKRKSKIKSKLFHKIKKKQKDREEKLLLEQLEDVDQEAVKSYLDKKKLARIQERIELKHSFNSKFNKTIKRYNLKNDENVKEAIKENLKLRDELMKKIKYNDGEEESEKSENEVEEENFDEDHNQQNDIEEEDDENIIEEDEEEEIDEDKLLINFDENEKNETKNTSNEKGVWGMKFMKNNLQSKLQDVLNDIDGSDEELNYSEDEDENFGNKKSNKNKKSHLDEDSENDVSKDILSKNKVLNSRRVNILHDEKTETNLKNNNQKETTNYKVTTDILNSLNDDAKSYLKNESQKINLNGEDIQKLIQMEEIKEDEEMFNNFLIENDNNKNDFLESAKPKVEANSKILSGWGSWAGETKTIQAKEFLKKKRYQEIEKKKLNQLNESNTTPNHVKVNNSFDKKFSNYMVKELPNNIRSREEFERLNKTTLGREHNSLTMYKKLIQPSIVKKIGQIIEPMKINDNTSAKKLCEIIEKATKKKQRTKAKI